MWEWKKELKRGKTEIGKREIDWKKNKIKRLVKEKNSERDIYKKEKTLKLVDVSFIYNLLYIIIYYDYLIFHFIFGFLQSFTGSLPKSDRSEWLYAFYGFMFFVTSFGWYFSVTLIVLSSAKCNFLHFI